MTEPRIFWRHGDVMISGPGGGEVLADGTQVERYSTRRSGRFGKGCGGKGWEGLRREGLRREGLGSVAAVSQQL